MQLTRLVIFFFFLLITLPPRSTLFPYTTLFRSVNNSEANNNDKKPTPKSHPQAYHTSHLLSFTKNLNEILDQEGNERLLPQSECFDCIVTDLDRKSTRLNSSH